MTNREKYADKILDIVCNGDNVAVSKTTNEPVACKGFSCAACTFGGSCINQFAKWCTAKYK